ncbi:hypothetical protein RRG08_057031 [Elysia crispata]|uniref:Uncharacterized protein n=1 Tax=Elysia crispata TaxID=231223 RepID=A0AAE0Z6G2_9GAST|nr:hypothetical protein RRG08_057031 [Elysia crispata]
MLEHLATISNSSDAIISGYAEEMLSYCKLKAKERSGGLVDHGLACLPQEELNLDGTLIQASDMLEINRDTCPNPMGLGKQILKVVLEGTLEVGLGDRHVTLTAPLHHRSFHLLHSEHLDLASLWTSVTLHYRYFRAAREGHGVNLRDENIIGTIDPEICPDLEKNLRLCDT